MTARRLEPLTSVNPRSAEDGAAAEDSGRVLMKSRPSSAEATGAACFITLHMIKRSAGLSARPAWACAVVRFHHTHASVHPGRDPNCLSGQGVRWKTG